MSPYSAICRRMSISVTLRLDKGNRISRIKSVTGDEDPFVHKYRADNPAFPHESTADQFFDEVQFEAYRSLGNHVGDEILKDPRANVLPGREVQQAMTAGAG